MCRVEKIGLASFTNEVIERRSLENKTITNKWQKCLLFYEACFSLIVSPFKNVPVDIPAKIKMPRSMSRFIDTNQ